MLGLHRRREGLKAAHEKYGSGGLATLLLDMGGMSPAQVTEYYRGQLKGADHAYAADEDLRVARAFRVRDSGTTIVIDRRGRIAFVDEDETPETELLPVVRRVLAERREREWRSAGA